MIPNKTLEQAIADIRIWRKGNERAPHKPLLLLYVLANYQRGHGRMFDYGSEFHHPLLNLLERFGPKRAAHYPQMPFWRLKGDGFWELHNAEQCSSTGSKEPPVTELMSYRVAGGFTKEHYARLTNNKNLICSLMQQILNAHFPENVQEEIAEEMGFDIQQIRKVTEPLFV